MTRYLPDLKSVHNTLLVVAETCLRLISTKTKESNQKIQGWAENSYEGAISAVEDFFDQWDPSTARETMLK